MHVISKKKLRQLWAMYPDSEELLRGWLQAARRERWKNFAEVKARFLRRTAWAS